jgi:hypothetical protein
MRSIVIVATIFVALTTVWVGKSQAVGLYVVGKEDCECSPLAARGIVPDTLNKLKEAFLVAHIAAALDKVAVEIKGMVDQFGKPPETEAAITPPEATEKEKSAIEEKPAKEKPAIDKKSEKKGQKAGIKNAKADNSKKKKKVKVPSRVM